MFGFGFATGSRSKRGVRFKLWTLLRISAPVYLQDVNAEEIEIRRTTGRLVGKPESAGMNRHVVGDAKAREAMLADVPVGESPIGGSAQLPPQ